LERSQNNGTAEVPLIISQELKDPSAGVLVFVQSLATFDGTPPQTVIDEQVLCGRAMDH